MSGAKREINMPSLKAVFTLSPFNARHFGEYIENMNGCKPLSIIMTNEVKSKNSNGTLWECIVPSCKIA